jgi:hypothetical protein
MNIIGKEEDKESTPMDILFKAIRSENASIDRITSENIPEPSSIPPIRNGTPVRSRNSVYLQENMIQAKTHYESKMRSGDIDPIAAAEPDNILIPTPYSFPRYGIDHRHICNLATVNSSTLSFVAVDALESGFIDPCGENTAMIPHFDSKPYCDKPAAVNKSPSTMLVPTRSVSPQSIKVRSTSENGHDVSHRKSTMKSNHSRSSTPLGRTSTNQATPNRRSTISQSLGSKSPPFTPKRLSMSQVSSNSSSSYEIARRFKDEVNRSWLRSPTYTQHVVEVQKRNAMKEQFARERISLRNREGGGNILQLFTLSSIRARKTISPLKSKPNKPTYSTDLHDHFLDTFHDYVHDNANPVYKDDEDFLRRRSSLSLKGNHEGFFTATMCEEDARDMSREHEVISSAEEIMDELHNDAISSEVMIDDHVIDQISLPPEHQELFQHKHEEVNSNEEPPPVEMDPPTAMSRLSNLFNTPSIHDEFDHITLVSEVSSTITTNQSIAKAASVVANLDEPSEKRSFSPKTDLKPVDPEASFVQTSSVKKKNSIADRYLANVNEKNKSLTTAKSFQYDVPRHRNVSNLANDYTQKNTHDSRHASEVYSRRHSSSDLLNTVDNSSQNKLIEDEMLPTSGNDNLLKKRLSLFVKSTTPRTSSLSPIPPNSTSPTPDVMRSEKYVLQYKTMNEVKSQQNSDVLGHS